MKTLLFIAKWILLPGLGAYGIICIMAWAFQERLMFLPRTLPSHFQFQFEFPFEEIYIDTRDGERLHGLLFRSDEAPPGEQDARKLVFYLHGNAGTLDGWGTIAGYYLRFGYDMFILDYRGFGKSTGSIRSEQQFMEDAQLAYEVMSARYMEPDIVVVGYSIGGAPAARIASENNPAHLLLKAPFHSIDQLRREQFPFLPGFLLRYSMPTWKFLRDTSVPVTIVHGNFDEVIPVSHSERLRPMLKDGDRLVILPGQTHNGMNHNPDFHEVLQTVLK